MNRFTAENAREIVASDSYSTRGYVIDQVRKAAKNGQSKITISDMKLSKLVSEGLEKDGFKINGKTITW